MAVHSADNNGSNIGTSQLVGMYAGCRCTGAEECNRIPHRQPRYAPTRLQLGVGGRTPDYKNNMLLNVTDCSESIKIFTVRTFHVVDFIVAVSGAEV